MSPDLDPAPSPSPFDGLPPETREAMEVAFAQALVESLRQEAAALNQARTGPAMVAGQTGRREFEAHGAVITP